MTTSYPYVLASESVSEGHPDKICDGISDALLDAYIARDPYARTAIETLVTTNYVLIAGEIRSSDPLSKQEIEDVTRRKIKQIGYEQERFHWEKLTCDIKLHEQSADIASGVDANERKDEGAGDQGIMFGYACNENNLFMPSPLLYAHQLLQALATDRHAGILDKLGPDAKSQFSIQYEDNKPVGCTSIVLSTQHDEGISTHEIRDIVMPYIQKILPKEWHVPQENIYINPTGKFVIGGPDGDTGLTGRKIIVDTYGGAAPHGGGAFSGKDPTKVDRSAAYAMRYLAKNIVAAGLSEQCTIQISYAIGVSEPLSLHVRLHGQKAISEKELAHFLPKLMDLSPRGIRQHLQLNNPIYDNCSAYGHFGREPREDGSFSWEKIDLVTELKRQFNV